MTLKWGQNQLYCIQVLWMDNQNKIKIIPSEQESFEDEKGLIMLDLLLLKLWRGSYLHHTSQENTNTHPSNLKTKVKTNCLKNLPHNNQSEQCEKARFKLLANQKNRQEREANMKWNEKSYKWTWNVNKQLYLDG